MLIICPVKYTTYIKILCVGRNIALCTKSNYEYAKINESLVEILVHLKK